MLAQANKKLEHHLVIEHPSYAYHMHTSAGVWSQSFVQVFKCNPIIKRPVLKKRVQFLYIIQMIFLFGAIMGMEKRNN